MSDELHKAEELDTEVHAGQPVNIEPADEDESDDVVAHVRKANVRMDSPRKF